MRKKTALLGFIFCCALALPLAAHDTMLFARTVRGASAIKSEGEPVPAGGFCAAKGCELSCAEGETLACALSNGAVIMLKGDSKAKIAEASQEPSKSRGNVLSDEKSPSITKVELQRGELYMLRPPARPTSAFEVSTAFGTVSAGGENLYVKLCEGSETACAVDFAASFQGLGAEAPEYIGIGYMFKIKSENGKIAGSRERMHEKDASRLKRVFDSLNDAKLTTAFEFSEDGKALKAYRIFPKFFYARDPKRTD